MFSVDNLEDMDKPKDESKRHPRPYFSEGSALNTFIKKDTCKKKKEKKRLYQTQWLWNQYILCLHKNLKI